MMFWIRLLILLSLSAAAAHNVSFSDLQGKPLCVDDASIKIYLSTGNPLEEATLTEAIRSRLRTKLISTLERFTIPHRVVASCADDGGFVLVDFYVSWNHEDEPEASVVFLGGAQVGVKPAESSELVLQLSSLRFIAGESVLLLASDLPGPYEDVLPRATEDYITDLAVSWWDDLTIMEETRVLERRIFFQRAGIISAVLSLLLVLFGLNHYRLSNTHKDKSAIK